MTEKKRTDLQNRSLHLFFRLLARSLNDAGYDQRKVLKESIEIPWDEKAIKERLWRPIQISMTEKRSTTELAKHVEIEEIHSVLLRHLGEKFGIEYIPFPSNENAFIANIGYLNDWKKKENDNNR